MRLLVLGATGEIGSAVVAAALERGHEVTAFVRSPDKLGDLGARVRVVTGDLTDAAALASAVPGHDAVISAIGSSPDSTQLHVPATVMRLLIEAMHAASVRRLVGLSGGAVDVPGERKPLGGRIASAVVRRLARNVVEAKQREFETVHGSELDWTMVRPPRVVPAPPSGRFSVASRLGGFRIGSGDVGVAMVQLAEGREWLRQAPYVSSG